MKDAVVVKSTLKEGKLYGVHLKDGYVEISEVIPGSTATYRPFKVTNGEGINNGFNEDQVPIGSVPTYLRDVYGIELNTDALNALGLTLDRTASTIIEEGNRVKSDWNVTIETNKGKKPVTDIDGSGSLISRAQKYGA